MVCLKPVMNIVVSCFLSLLPIFAMANDESVNKLHQLLQSYESFSADFEQVTLGENGRQAQKTSGILVMAKPNLYRWETRLPFPQEIVSDGQHLWIYDPDLEQVTQRSAQSQETSAPALILNGNLAQLQEKYAVRMLSDSGMDQIFELQPLAEQSDFSVIRLAFSEGIIAELMLEDSLGQRTSIVFSEQQINPTFSKQMFDFRVPEGVDLLVDQGA